MDKIIMRNFFILTSFLACAVLHAQNNSGFSVSAELFNFNQIVDWEEVNIYYAENSNNLNNPPPAYVLNFNRLQGIGKKSKAQFFTYGISVLYFSSTFQKPNLTFPIIDPEYGLISSPYLIRTDQLYAGINLGYEKTIPFDKRKRNNLALFFALQAKAYYGVWQQQAQKSEQYIESEFLIKEPIAADNYFMASVQANIGVQYFFSKKHDKSMKLYLPINYTYNADKNFNSFPVLGFVGVSFDWL